MATWHGYLGIENINLNSSQRQTLVQAIRALGPSNHSQPCMLNHWRTRLDNDAAIFEALFDEDNLTVNWFKQRLGAIFGVSWVTIGHSVQNVTFVSQNTPIVTFSRTGTDYLRMALFGGTGATWEQSRVEVLGYLAANQAEWEPVEP